MIQGNLFDIISIESHSLKFSEYLKLDKKPYIRIENEIFFHINDNFFINADSRKADLESSYIYFSREYIQVVDDWIHVGLHLKFNDDAKVNNKSIKEKQYVYLMLDKRNGSYKIGISKTPEYRETTLQSEQPQIVLVTYFDGSKKDESYLHKKFNNKRIRGEWFNINKDDIKFIENYFK